MVRKSRSKTEEEKVAASTQMKRHWRRCEAWGEVLGVTKMEMNDHWSCCIKPHLDAGLPGVKTAYTDHLLRNAQHSERMENLRASVYVEKYYVARLKKTDEIPELDQRIKIMLWSIRTCGGVENAKDALDRAIKALEDK